MTALANSILIVDSDVKFRNALASRFEEIGWKVYIAKDCHSAIQSMNRHNPDIILIDLKLPVRDGISTCRLIRNDIKVARHFPLILMSNSPAKQQIIAAIDAGCDDFIVKPFKFEILLAKVEALVEFHIKKKREEDKEEQVSNQEEEKEAEIIIYSKNIVEKAFSNAMHGKLVDYPVIKKTVNKMVEIVYKESTLPMAFKMRSYNEYTYIHSVNVASLSMSFAYHLKWPDSDLQILGEGGLLHDIGKTGIDLRILLKPDKLTDEEFDEMKKHPLYGVEIAARQKVDPKIRHVIAEHHERMDGSGYPYSLTKDKISKYGKLDAIVDVYDALTTDRCYHKGIDSGEAIKKMASWYGKFDPDLMKVFSSLVTEETIGK